MRIEQAVVRFPPGHNHIPFIQLEAHAAVHHRLRVVYRSLQHPALWRPPVAVVDQLGVARHQLVFQVCNLAIQRDGFYRPVGFQHDRAAGCFVAAAGFHAHIAVLHDIVAADAVGAADAVEFRKHRGGAHRLAVQAHYVAAGKFEFDIGCLIGCVFRAHAPAPHVLFRLRPGVLQLVALVGDMQQVGIHRVGRFLLRPGVIHRNIVLLAVGHEGFARAQVPLPPGRYHMNAGLQRVGAELKAHLVVTLAGGAVGDGIRAGFVGNLDQALGNQGPGDGGTEQVFTLVNGVGAKHGEDKIAHELLAQVFNVDFANTHGLGLGARGLQLLALADISGEGNHLAAVVLLQPAGDHRGIETAGVGQHHFVDIRRHVLLQEIIRRAAILLPGAANSQSATRHTIRSHTFCDSMRPWR